MVLKLVTCGGRLSFLYILLAVDFLGVNAFVFLLIEDSCLSNTNGLVRQH